jgi:ATP-dependent RNA helicase DeaD
MQGSGDANDGGPAAKPAGSAKAPAAARSETAAAPAPAYPKKTFKDEAPRPAASAPKRAAEAAESASDFAEARVGKSKYERPARTGREAGYTTVFVNVGRKELITPADLVGKIAGVTRLPANIVGAIDIHQRHALIDVISEHASLVITRLAGIRVKGETLKPALASEVTESA